MANFIVSRYISCGKDCDTLRISQGRRLIDFYHPSPRIGAPNRTRIQHPRDSDIIHIDPSAQGFFNSIHPLHIMPQFTIRSFIRNRCLFSQHLSSQLDAFDDFHITCATANIAANPFSNFFLSWIWFFTQKSQCRNDKSRDTIAALNGSSFGKSISKDVLLSLRNAFYRRNFFAVNFC